MNRTAAVGKETDSCAGVQAEQTTLEGVSSPSTPPHTYWDDYQPTSTPGSSAGRLSVSQSRPTIPERTLGPCPPHSRSTNNISKVTALCDFTDPSMPAFEVAKGVIPALPGPTAFLKDPCTQVQRQAAASLSSPDRSLTAF